MELGSGPGLGGFVASKWAREVILSDYQDVVLDLMESNIASYNHNAATCPMYAAKIDWYDINKDQYYEKIELVAEDGTVAGRMGNKTLDVVIGTDVIYWRHTIDPLIDTLEALFAHNQELKIYICYIERHLITHNELKEKLSARGFVLTEFGQEITKPINEHSYMYEISKPSA